MGAKSSARDSSPTLPWSEPMIESQRAVLLRYTDRTGARVGSGIQVGGGYVLTADHCADGVGHRIISGGESYDATVAARSRDQAFDLALLLSLGLPPLERMSFGCIDRRTIGQVPCSALGFPAFVTSGFTPTLCQADGYVPSAEGQDPASPQVGGTPLTFVLPDRFPAVPRGGVEDPTSQWAGMSGAGVVTRTGHCIGVVSSHTRAHGANTLTVTSLDHLSLSNGSMVEPFLKALGINPRVDLPFVLPGPENGLDVQVARETVRLRASPSTTKRGTVEAVDFSNRPGDAQLFVDGVLMSAPDNAGDGLEQIRSRLSAAFATVSQVGSGVLAIRGSLCGEGDVTIIDARCGPSATLSMPDRDDTPPRLVFPDALTSIELGIPRMWILRPSTSEDVDQVLVNLESELNPSPDASGRPRLPQPPEILTAKALGAFANLSDDYDVSQVARVASLSTERVELDGSAREFGDARTDAGVGEAPADSTAASDGDILNRLRVTVAESFRRSSQLKGGFTGEALTLQPRGVRALVKGINMRLEQAREEEARKQEHLNAVLTAFDGEHDGGPSAD